MRESDKCIGISRDSNVPASPIGGIRISRVSCFACAIEGVCGGSAQKQAGSANLKYCSRREASFLTQINECRAARVMMRFCCGVAP